MKYSAEERAIKVKYRLLALQHLNHLKDEVKDDPHTWSEDDEDLQKAREYLFKSEMIRPKEELINKKKLTEKLMYERMTFTKRAVLKGFIDGLSPARIAKESNLPLEEIYHIALESDIQITPTFLWKLTPQDQFKKVIYFNDRRVLRRIFNPEPNERLTDQNLLSRGYLLENGRFDWSVIEVGALYALSIRDGIKVKRRTKFTA